MNFSEEQIERYSRHIILADVGPEGQEAILNGKVLIVGAGGLVHQHPCILQLPELELSDSLMEISLT